MWWIVALPTFVAAATSGDFFVATTGIDDSTCGANTTPCLTLGHAFYNRLRGTNSSTVLHLAAGEYGVPAAGEYSDVGPDSGLDFMGLDVMIQGDPTATVVDCQGKAYGFLLGLPGPASAPYPALLPTAARPRLCTIDKACVVVRYATRQQSVDETTC